MAWVRCKSIRGERLTVGALTVEVDPTGLCELPDSVADELVRGIPGEYAVVEGAAAVGPQRLAVQLREQVAGLAGENERLRRLVADREAASAQQAQELRFHLADREAKLAALAQESAGLREQAAELGPLRARLAEKTEQVELLLAQLKDAQTTAGAAPGAEGTAGPAPSAGKRGKR